MDRLDVVERGRSGKRQVGAIRGRSHQSDHGLVDGGIGHLGGDRQGEPQQDRQEEEEGLFHG